MIKKILKNFKLTGILFITVAIVLWVIEGFKSVESMIRDYWWFWILLPFVLRFYNWFMALKQKAYDYGADTSGVQAERKAAKGNERNNLLKKQYEEMLANASYTKAEAYELRNRMNYESLALQKSLSEISNNYTIPLHRYSSGLPGPNLIRSSELKQQFTVASISNGNLEFYNSSPYEYEKKSTLKDKFSKIPLASIIKLEVVDIVEDRELKRIGAQIGQRMTQTLVNAATGGARVTKSNVDAAKLLIHYVNEDGIVIPATFVFNSNSKFGVRAMKNLNELNKTLRLFSFLGRIKWSIETMECTEELVEGLINDENDFDFSEVTSLAGDMLKVLKWANILNPHDSAVLTAKLSAEMIAGVLHDPSVPLIKTIK